MGILHTAEGVPLARTRAPACRPHAVQLQAATLEGDDPNRVREDAVWIQVAREGEYKGYRTGPFTLSQADFEEMVRNFRTHPSFKTGEDGLGVEDVIPFDFHHESENHGGSIATIGAPAQAWAMDLEVRTGEVAELWALTRYLEPALSYVRDGKYKWTSIVAWPDCVHPVTGERIGWYISSIAFTNDPFIQGMQPIAASRANASSKPTPGASPIMLDDEKELDVDIIMSDLRWNLGLPSTAGIADVAAEMAKLETMLAQDEPPAGVDLPNIVSQMRWLLRLPLLTPAEEVMAQMRELLARLSAATDSETATSTTTPTPPPPEPFPMSKAHEEIITKLLKLAKDRGWRVLESELPDKLAMELKSSELAANVISSLAEMLEIKSADPQDVLDEISKRSAELEKVKGMLPQLQELLGEQVSAEEDMVEEDVTEAMQAQNMPDSAKVALVTHRTGGISLDVQVDERDPMPGIFKLSQAVAARRKQREKFLESYPPVPPQQQHLQQPLVTQPGSTAGAVVAGRGGPQQGAPPAMPPAPLGTEGGGQQAPWAAYPGETDVLRCMAYLKDKQGGAKTLGRQDAWKQACTLVAQHNHQQTLH